MNRSLGISSRRSLAILLTSFLTFTLFTTTGCGSDEDEAAAEAEETAFEMGEPLQDTTLAAIVISDDGGDTLYTSEFRAQIGQIMQQFPQLEGDLERMQELRRSIVEGFVLSHALSGELADRGIVADTAEVEQQISQFRSRFETEEAFQQALAAQNVSEADVRQSLQEQAEQRQWQEQIHETVEDPSEEEVETYREEQAEQVRARHILFYSPSPDSAAKAKAEAVLDTLQQGAVPFEELARRHSDDGSAAQGGDLGFFSRGQMVEPFADAAFALADSGDVVDEPVRTEFGYHIIQLTGKRTGEMMAEEQAREALLGTRRREALDEALDRLREQVTVRLNPEVVEAELNAEPALP